MPLTLSTLRSGAARDCLRLRRGRDVKTSAVLDALRRRHALPVNGDTPAWIYVEELRCGTGWRSYSTAEAYVNPESRMDAFALHTWPSKNLLRIAYEVKVTRGDLVRELADPEKRTAAMALSNQFYFVVASDVETGPFDVPNECGLIRCSDAGNLRIVRRAPWRDVGDPPILFLVSLARTLYKRAER